MDEAIRIEQFIRERAWLDKPVQLGTDEERVCLKSVVIVLGSSEYAHIHLTLSSVPFFFFFFIARQVSMTHLFPVKRMLYPNRLRSSHCNLLMRVRSREFYFQPW